MKKAVLNDVIDWFGTDIAFYDETEEEVTARVTVNWHAMRHWALQYCRHVCILAPSDLAEHVQQDLADALNQGVIAGAGLDVLSIEPSVENNPLLKAKNCFITPHIAWATKEARTRLMNIAVNNLKSYQEGHIINNVAK